MKPGAGIDKGRIPALQHIVHVLPLLPLIVQYVTFKSQNHGSEKKNTSHNNVACQMIGNCNEGYLQYCRLQELQEQEG